MGFCLKPLIDIGVRRDQRSGRLGIASMPAGRLFNAKLNGFTAALNKPK